MTRCDDLDTFFDGELSAERAQGFRVHLATCTRCQGALRGRMLEAVVVEHGAEGCALPASDLGYTDQLAARRRTRHWAVIAALAASIALISGPERRDGNTRLSDVLRPTRAHSPTAIALAEVRLAPRRAAEVRFSTAELDHHRPRNIVRAADQADHERITSATLAALEGHGDVNALVAAHALNGELPTAMSAARQLANTAQSLSDRAALELLRVSDAGKRVPPAEQQQAAEQAISLAAAALRLEPRNAQAQWNQAIALARLGLPLAAAQTYDAVAALAEPGWSEEAKDSAKRLRDEYQREADEWSAQRRDADGVVAGAPVVVERARRYPSLARRTLYLATATAATRERLDALLPLAEALDQGDPAAGAAAFVRQIRGSNLARRAPLASALHAALAGPAHSDALAPIRTRALELGLPDIALATLAVQSPAETTASDLAVLTKLAAAHRDAWWRTLELQRRAWNLEYEQRDSSKAEAVARAAGPLCSTAPSLWCARIARIAGDANAVLGRIDVALERLEAARKLARDPATRDDEAGALNVIAQVMSMRVQEAIDPVAVSDAYYREVELRGAQCSVRLQRFDTLASAAIERHRYRDAADLLSRGQALEDRECRGADARSNNVAARLRLVEAGHADATALQQQLARLEPESHSSLTSYLHYLRAAAMVHADRSAGEAALRAVIAAADADPSAPNALPARANAYATLIELAAAAGEADSVLAQLARRLGVPAPDGCVVGIAQWNRAVVAVRGASGTSTVEIRSVPEGAIMVAPDALIPAPLRARLVGCRRVEVLASGPYFGTAGILGPSVAWAYRSARRSAARPAQPASELVVTDVRPPDDFALAPLRTFHGSPSAIVLDRSRATPGATIDQMRTAGLIVIVAHGITDAREPDAASLILSPDRDGDYLLTASKVSAARLESSPIVVLAGCDAGRVQVSAEPWSLATSFLAAGARAVIAPTEQIPDDEAGKAFEALVERIRAGADPVDALQSERQRRASDAAWLSSIIVFE